MCVGVNLHPYLEHLRVRSPKFNDCVRRVKAIDVDLQITTVVAQRIRLRELARHHDHSVKGTSNNIGDASSENCAAAFNVDTVMPLAPAA